MTPSVAVVGAGPVGLTAALVLARRGVRVTLLEAEAELGRASRASTFHPSTLDLLDELGVAERFLPLGRRVPSLQWRDRTGALLAEMDYAVLGEATRHPYRLHAEQTRLTPLLADALLATGNAEIRWSSPVRRVRQDADGVDLDEVRADYVIAADGAHSTVRRELGLSFDGVEYPTFALRVITSTELDRLIPGLSPMTYIRDERQSCSLLGLPDHWRVILRLPHSTSPESAVTAVPELLARALPGVADRIEVRDAHVYRTSRRVLESYRDGRVLFAGDAAHLTSTAGGMNMNCGVHDAVDIAEAVASVLAGGDTRRLDEAAARRRAVVTDLVIPRSEARVSGVDGKAGAGVAAAVASIAATAADPVRARGFLVEASLLDASPRLIGAF